MAHSTDFIPHTCGKVRKVVAKMDLSYIIEAANEGDITVEEALRRAALDGAALAQLYGAEQVRGAFDSYIRAVERGEDPAAEMKEKTNS